MHLFIWQIDPLDIFTVAWFLKYKQLLHLIGKLVETVQSITCFCIEHMVNFISYILPFPELNSSSFIWNLHFFVFQPSFLDLFTFSYIISQFFFVAGGHWESIFRVSKKVLLLNKDDSRDQTRELCETIDFGPLSSTNH